MDKQAHCGHCGDGPLMGAKRKKLRKSKQAQGRPVSLKPKVGAKRKKLCHSVPILGALGCKRKLLKTASAEDSTPRDEGRNLTYNDLIADSDRYLTDAFYITISLRETVDGFSVACHVNAEQIGTTSFGQYWKFQREEYEQAQKTFADAKTMAINIRRNAEYERLPFALILPMFRHEARKIDTEHIEVSHIPHIRYSLDVVQEKDWRQILYGKRYPTEMPAILNYDVDHTIDEQSHYVTTTPGLGRDNIFRYKYASVIKPKLGAKRKKLAEYFPYPRDQNIGLKRQKYQRYQKRVTVPPFFTNPNAVEPIDQVGDW